MPVKAWAGYHNHCLILHLSIHNTATVLSYPLYFDPSQQSEKRNTVCSRMPNTKEMSDLYCIL